MRALTAGSSPGRHGKGTYCKHREDDGAKLSIECNADAILLRFQLGQVLDASNHLPYVRANTGHQWPFLVIQESQSFKLLKPGLSGTTGR